MPVKSSSKPKVAINGFGRIGRQVYRVNMDMGYPLDIIAVNNIGDNKTTAHLLKYDSNFGTLNAEVICKNANTITVGDKTLIYLEEKDPLKLPWKDLGIDIVIECTGIFKDREGASKHLTVGAKKVIISAPGKDPDITMVLGINQDEYNPDQHHIISNASCTTNCLAPVVKVLNDKLGIIQGFMTTIHSYTNDQRLQDLEHHDMRRARAAAINIIPTSTGAARTVAEVIPELKGKLDGHSIRVPTPVVSIVDFVCNVKKETSIEEVNTLFKDASQSYLRGIMDFTMEPLVSTDFKKNTHSSIVDGLSTLIINDTFIKVLSWYDNEWGYSCRTVDMTKMIADKL